RPRSPVLGRFQQKRPRPVGGQLAVGRQRCLGVGEHLASDRDEPMSGSQRAKLRPGGGGGEVGDRWHGVYRRPMKAGDLATEFVLPDQNGTSRKLSDFLAAGPVVLFFYPVAGSPGCTKEACHFRDLAQEFADLGASRVGISTDRIAKQAAF